MKSFHDYIDNGFDEENIKSLKQLCRNSFSSNPTISFVLHILFTRIEDCYEGQAIPVDIYGKISEIGPLAKDAIEQKDLKSIDHLLVKASKIFSLFD
jgi:hypothetical protein